MPSARETRVPLAEVDEQSKDSLSLMPLGLLDELSQGDLADLIAFLQSEPAQQTLRNSQRIEHMLAAGPIEEGSEAALLSPRQAAAPIKDGGKTIAWTQLDSNSGGLFNLQGQLAPTPSSALLTVTIDSPIRQDASLRYGILGRSRVFLNGEKVGVCPTIESMSLDKALVRLPIEPGKNTLVIAVDRPPGGPALGTFVLGSAAPVRLETPKPHSER